MMNKYNICLIIVFALCLLSCRTKLDVSFPYTVNYNVLANREHFADEEDTIADSSSNKIIILGVAELKNYRLVRTALSYKIMYVPNSYIESYDYNEATLYNSPQCYFYAEKNPFSSKMEKEYNFFSENLAYGSFGFGVSGDYLYNNKVVTYKGLEVSPYLLSGRYLLCLVRVDVYNQQYAFGYSSDDNYNKDIIGLGLHKDDYVRVAYVLQDKK